MGTCIPFQDCCISFSGDHSGNFVGSFILCEYCLFLLLGLFFHKECFKAPGLTGGGAAVSGLPLSANKLGKSPTGFIHNGQKRREFRCWIVRRWELFCQVDLISYLVLIIIRYTWCVAVLGDPSFKRINVRLSIYSLLSLLHSVCKAQDFKCHLIEWHRFQLHFRYTAAAKRGGFIRYIFPPAKAMDGYVIQTEG